MTLAIVFALVSATYLGFCHFYNKNIDQPLQRGSIWNVSFENTLGALSVRSVSRVALISVFFIVTRQLPEPDPSLQDLFVSLYGIVGFAGVFIMMRSPKD